MEIVLFQFSLSFLSPIRLSTSDNLADDVSNFLTQVLKLERRELDSNMKVFKTWRPHTVLISLSDRRFKRFLFTGLKNFRESNRSTENKVFINDNLTKYNYDIMKKLKEERDQMSEAGRDVYELVYAFEGKIFVKKRIGDPTDAAIHIKTVSSMKNFVSTYRSVPANSA